MSEELELKFRGSDLSALRGWLDRQLPRQVGQRWRRMAIADRYFDTVDDALAASGYGARVREHDGQYSLTLKSDLGSVGATHQRNEIVGPAGNSLDPDSWPSSVAKTLVVATAGERMLVEKFRLRQRRDEREAMVGGGRVLLSLDRVEVLAGGRVIGVLRELEVELLDGDRRGLPELARAIRASGLAVSEPRNKMVIANELALAAARVTLDDRWAQAGAKVMRRHLLRMLEREPAARRGDGQAIKQLRVATRRMRATWRLFAAGYRADARRELLVGLRDLGRSLGAVRDLDVLLERLPRRQGLVPLAAAWRVQRESALAELLSTLNDATHPQLLRRQLALVNDVRPAGRRRHRAASVADMAPAALMAMYGDLTRGGLPGRGATDEEWHSLRRNSRLLRYAIEALRDVLPADQSTRLIARLVAVQDHLGAMNDAVVAAQQAHLWLDATTDVTETARAAVERYGAEQRSVAERKRHSFGRVWTGVSGVVFARMLRRATTQLEQR